MSSAVSFEPGAQVEGGIPLCVPEIRGNEWAYVRECLETGWVSSVGAFVTRFEDELARLTQTRHAVATVNGTAALHVALLCAGVEAGDAVLVSDLTFIAPANAIRYVGAHPVCIDAEPAYWQIDPALVERYCREECAFEGGELRERASGRRVRAIVPVSLLGHPVELEPILAVARAYGLVVIEDATESLGSRYHDRPVGADADVTCFSFNGNKLVTTGGGGMLCTNDARIAARARYLTTQAKDDPIEYVHGAVGYNYRLSNVQAAIGVAQLEQLGAYVAIKRANAARYAEALGGIEGIALPREAPHAFSTFWLYTILVDEARFGCSSRALLERLARGHIQTRPLWQPMHRSPAQAGARTVGGEVAEAICRDALSLPSSVGLTAAQLDAVVAAIRAERA